MAEPILTASLLTPVSIRLAWTYTGSADFEVFWKSDHPAGQDYVLLGRTTALTYDVAALSWTTTYYFKVRAVSGATYGAFSNEMKIFVCCGQAYAYTYTTIPAVPPTDFTTLTSWQMSLDIQDGQIAITIPMRYTEANAYWVLEVDELGNWTYKEYISVISIANTPYDVFRDSGNTYIMEPGGARMWTFRQGVTTVNSWPGYGIQKDITFDSAGRVVVLLVGPGTGIDYLYLAISRDYGVTFEAPVAIGDVFDYTYNDNMTYMQEASDGTLWFFVSRWSDALYAQRGYVYKYTEGGTFDLVWSIDKDMSYGYNWSYQSIDIDGSIIAVTYIVDATTIQNSAYVDYSLDGGVSWTSKQVDLSMDYAEFNGPLVISDGNFITYGWNSTNNRYCIKRSTDYGDTWVEVVNLDTYYMPYPQYVRMRADGLDIVFTSCAFSTVSGGDLGYIRSSDAGATWTWVAAQSTPGIPESTTETVDPI